MSHLDGQTPTSLTLSGKPIKWSWLVDCQRKIYACHQNVRFVFSRGIVFFFRADLTHNTSKARIRQRIHTFIWLLWQTAVYLTSLAQKTIDAEIADKSWPRFLLFKADINHVFLCETITATPALRLWFLTSKWRTMPKGIWIGRCFLTLITPALHDHVKHKHIPHLCRTTWTESYDIGQESLDARLGPARRRLHLRVTS